MFSEAFDLAIGVVGRLGIGTGNHTGCSPYHTEIRRRCWWTLCRLSYHRIRQHASAPEDLVLSSDVPLPLNINDIDLTSVMDEMPKARQGPTEMSFFLNNLEVIRLTNDLELLKSTLQSPGSDVAMRLRRRDLVDRAVSKIEKDFLWHCDTSRPLDWFLMLTTKAMLVGEVELHSPRSVKFADTETESH